MPDAAINPKARIARKRRKSFGIAGSMVSPVYFYVCTVAGRGTVGADGRASKWTS
jgi:hypothetical protein